jgi:hypothetical protein
VGPMVLPWNPDLSRTEVGSAFRALVQNKLEGAHPAEEAAAEAVADLLNWSTDDQGGEVSLRGDGSQAGPIPTVDMNGRTYGDVEELAARLGRTVGWDPDSRTVSIA